MSETTEKVAELKPSGKSVAIHPGRFTQQAQYVLQISHLTLPNGVALEECLKPEFWAHIASKLRPFGRILVDAEDGSLSAQLKVHRATGLEAVVSIEWVKREETAALPEALSAEDKYRIHWAGGAKWRVSRLSDGATISDGHATKEMAQNELRGHLQAMAA